MRLVILTGKSNMKIAVNPDRVIAVRERCNTENDADNDYRTNIDTDNFTYLVKEDFGTVCSSLICNGK